jgi:hypothetical protein
MNISEPPQPHTPIKKDLKAIQSEEQYLPELLRRKQIGSDDKTYLINTIRQSIYRFLLFHNNTIFFLILSSNSCSKI